MREAYENALRFLQAGAGRGPVQAYSRQPPNTAVARPAEAPSELRGSVAGEEPPAPLAEADGPRVDADAEAEPDGGGAGPELVPLRPFIYTSEEGPQAIGDDRDLTLLAAEADLEVSRGIAETLSEHLSAARFAEAARTLLEPRVRTQVDVDPRLAVYVPRVGAGAAWNAPDLFERLRAAYPLLFRSVELSYLGGALIHLPRSRLGFEAWRGNAEAGPGLMRLLSQGLVVDDPVFLELCEQAAGEIRADPEAALTCVGDAELHDGDLVGLWSYMLRVRASVALAMTQEADPGRLATTREIVARVSWLPRHLTGIAVATFVLTASLLFALVYAFSGGVLWAFLWSTVFFIIAASVTRLVHARVSSPERLPARAAHAFVEASLSATLAPRAFERTSGTSPSSETARFAELIGAHEALCFITTVAALHVDERSSPPGQ